MFRRVADQIFPSPEGKRVATLANNDRRMLQYQASGTLKLEMILPPSLLFDLITLVPMFHCCLALRWVQTRSRRVQ